MSKFKVGDKVRVTNKRSSFFDEEGIIKDVSRIQAASRNRIYYILFERTGYAYFGAGYAYFGELDIALVTRKTKKFKVGDKVRVTTKGLSRQSHWYGKEGFVQSITPNGTHRVVCEPIGYGYFFDSDLELVPKESKKSKPIDPYAELRLAYANGKTIQYCATTTWRDMIRPSWSEPPESYRVKPEEESDPYAELKKAFAEGKTIQGWREISSCGQGRWHDVDPRWCKKPSEYRVKPEEESDPYAELKKAKAEGKQIQYYSKCQDKWIGVNRPQWSEPPEFYRVKPEKVETPVTPEVKPTQTNKEMKMKFETKHYLNGQDITNLENIDIYREIAREESALKALGEVQNKPKRLQKEIAQREAELKAFVEFLDAQDGE